MTPLHTGCSRRNICSLLFNLASFQIGYTHTPTHFKLPGFSDERQINFFFFKKKGNPGQPSGFSMGRQRSEAARRDARSKQESK